MGLTAKEEFGFSDLMHGGGEMKKKSLDVAEELEKRNREVNALTAKEDFGFSDLMHGGGEMKKRSLDVLNKMAEELEKRGREVNALTAKEDWWNPFAVLQHVVHGAAHILHHTIHGVSMAAHGLLVGDEEMKKKSLDVLNKMAEELEKRIIH